MKCLLIISHVWYLFSIIAAINKIYIRYLYLYAFFFFKLGVGFSSVQFFLVINIYIIYIYIYMLSTILIVNIYRLIFSNKIFFNIWVVSYIL